MNVTLEVANEANGMGVVKRCFLRSEDFASAADLEAAVLRFIRESQAANEEVLEGHLTSVSQSVAKTPRKARHHQ
jgi:hypothetical protein